MVSFGILQISLTHEESDKLTENKILTSNLTKCVCLCAIKYLKCEI
jgi:anaerobic C4-dicarboxylate transporter